MINRIKIQILFKILNHFSQVQVASIDLHNFKRFKYFFTDFICLKRFKIPLPGLKTIKKNQIQSLLYIIRNR